MFTSCFYLLLFALLGTLLYLYRQALKRAGRSPETIRFNLLTAAAGLTLWVAYTAALSYAGVLRDFTPPPRIVLFLVLPAFVWITWFFRSGRYRELLEHTPPGQILAVQTFRIGVEFLILGIALRGLAPRLLTFEGRNFDIVAGLTAPLIAWLLVRHGNRFRTLAFGWNIAGMALLVNIVFMFVTCALRPDLWGFDSIPLHPDFGSMPYMLIPAVFMPTAVFLHVLSLHQTAPQRTKSRRETVVVRE